MNKIFIGLLLSGGFAIAQDPAAPQNQAPAQDLVAAQDQVPAQAESPNPQRMAWWTREALATQSPRIHLEKIRNDRVVREGDRIVSDKTTINAFVPWGK